VPIFKGNVREGRRAANGWHIRVMPQAHSDRADSPRGICVAVKISIGSYQMFTSRCDCDITGTVITETSVDDFTITVNWLTIDGALATRTRRAASLVASTRMWSTCLPRRSRSKSSRSLNLAGRRWLLKPRAVRTAINPLLTTRDPNSQFVIRARGAWPAVTRGGLTLLSFGLCLTGECSDQPAGSNG